MAYNVTLLQLRAKVLRRLHLEQSANPDQPLGPLTVAEINDYVNDSIAELWDLLNTLSYGDAYFQTVGATFNTVSGTSLYLLNGTVCPSNDFLRLCGLDVLYNGIYVPIRRFTNLERTRNQNVNWVIPTFGNVRYKLTGVNLELLPVPTSVFVIRPRYVPTATVLVNDADTFDSINAWHEYVVVDVCGKIADKIEQDSSPFMARKGELTRRIQDSAPNRDEGEPYRVTDVSGLMDNYVDDYFDLWR